MYSNIGMSVPLHCTAVGKAILASLPEDRLGIYFQSNQLTRFTETTITEPALLKVHLEEIRSRGFAIDDGEHEEEVRCIAAPLFARTQEVVGAVSIAAVSFRVSMEQLMSWVPDLRAVATQLNTDLAHYFDRYI